jgi:hypothetical protein
MIPKVLELSIKAGFGDQGFLTGEGHKIMINRYPM